MWSGGSVSAETSGPQVSGLGSGSGVRGCGGRGCRWLVWTSSRRSGWRWSWKPWVWTRVWWRLQTRTRLARSVGPPLLQYWTWWACRLRRRVQPGKRQCSPSTAPSSSRRLSLASRVVRPRSKRRRSVVVRRRRRRTPPRPGRVFRTADRLVGGRSSPSDWRAQPERGSSWAVSCQRRRRAASGRVACSVCRASWARASSASASVGAGGSSSGAEAAPAARVGGAGRRLRRGCGGWSVPGRGAVVLRLFGAELRKVR